MAIKYIGRTQIDTTLGICTQVITILPAVFVPIFFAPTAGFAEVQNIQRSSQNIPQLDQLSYSIRGLSSVTDIGTTTLYADAKTGTLTAHKVGNKLIVTKVDAINYLNRLPKASEVGNEA